MLCSLAHWLLDITDDRNWEYNIVEYREIVSKLCIDYYESKRSANQTAAVSR